MMKDSNYSENSITKIVIAEDSPTQAEQLKYILEQHNFNVIVARDGQEALEMVIKHKPAMLISDIVMPKMNGYELCEKIKSEESTMEIPVILLTSLSNSEDVLEGLICGADNFLTKPYKEDYLLSHVERILANIKYGDIERVRVGVEIMFRGKKRFITADQQQMLTLLISTYEAAMQRNSELIQTQNDLKKLNEHLEDLVKERTAELSAEIAIRKRAEERINKLNRLYAVLSNINQAIVRIHDINQLFKDVTLIAIDEGKFQSAWIGIINKETLETKTSVSSGVSNDLINVCPNENPITAVIRSGKHFICNDIYSATDLPSKWKKNVLSLGFQSFAVLPIIVFKNTIGSFCIYSNEINFFDELEVNLLDEMADDISFAIEFIQNDDERKHTENELQKSRTELSEYFENDISADYLVSLKGEILSCNRTFLKLFGFITNKQTEKFNIAQLYRNPNNWKELTQMVAEKRKIENYEVDFKTIEGEVIPAIINAVGIFNNMAELIKIRGYIVDITNLKKAQQEILKLSQAVEQSPVSIIITDTNGNIEYGNPKVTEVTGYELGELVGKKPNIFRYEDKSETSDKDLWATISSGKEWHGEFHNKKKNGELFWEFASISPIYDEIHEISHYVIVKEDITERKGMLEELMKAKQKAEENDQLKSAFLANMSHEIRTPMNAVLGFSQFLLYDDITPEEKQVYLEYIQVNGESLLKIIDDIIDISKIHSKQLAIRFINFDLHVLFQELEMYYNNLLFAKAKKNVCLKLQLPTSSMQPFYIKTDETRLKQIFNNLISNAIKYTCKGEITIGYEIRESSIYYFVKDTGIGISPKNQALIFDRFVQFSNEFISRQDGTGLGLAISKELVTLLGGTINVESVEGVGSTFYFEIPIEKVQLKDIKLKDKKAIVIKQDYSKFIILIVDDEDSNYALVKRLLHETKIMTDWARNGKLAVEMVGKRNYDLIIMDIKMPEMDGIEATRIIKQSNHNIPIIVQTAFAMAESKEEAFKAGCDDFIMKPVSIDVFLSTISKYLNNVVS